MPARTGVGPGTAEAGPGTRARIVAAARTLFHIQGYESTSLKQISKAAEVHGGSLHYFFPKKSDLVEAVLQEYLELLEPVIMGPARASASDPVGRVMAVLGYYRRHLLETQFGPGCPIGALALELGDEYPRARELIEQNFERWRESVAEILRPADRPGDTDVSELASFVLTTMEGAVMLARGYRSLEHFDVAVNRLRRYLRDALEGVST